MTAGDVTLQPITADTLRDVLRLSVSPRQTAFVASNAHSLAQALFAPEAWYRAICVGAQIVGFVMLSDELLLAPPPGAPAMGVWRLMIDARHQGQGVGTQAMQRVIEHARQRGYESLELSYVPADDGPAAFYRRLGFVDTGRVDDDEVVVALPLARPAARSRAGAPLFELVSCDEQDRALAYVLSEAAMRPHVEAAFGRWDAAAQWALHNARWTASTHRRVVVDGVVAGLLAVEDESEELWLVKLYLRPACQGRGLGSALLGQLQDQARAAGQRIRLRVLKANPRARALYERHGFAVVDQAPERWVMRWTP